jgi:parallel beta-helix repeat protein
MKTKTILVVISVLMFCAAQPAFAEFIQVTNPGFEDTPSANGWTLSGTSGTYSPDGSAYPDLAPQGNNVAYADVGTLSQGTYEFLDGDTVYALIVEVGDRANVGFVSYAINLYAEPSHTLLASASSPSPPNGGWITAVANYDPNGVEPDPPQVLKIELVSDGVQTNFDCVRLIKMTDPILNLTQGTRYASIQAAIYAAVDANDVIEVPPGTYHEHINFFGKEVTLRSRSGDPTDTIIDGQFIDMSSGSEVLTDFKGSIFTCVSNGPTMVIDGFTITKGIGTRIGSYRYGGGMRNVESDPTVSNCIFSYNSVYGDGGGMYNNPASPTVTNCTFTANHADYAGGGMDNRNGSNPTVTGCTFADNTAGTYGGGMENWETSNPTVTGCDFTGNIATLNGGGMSNVTNCSPTVTDCDFTGNIATQHGGGMYITINSNPTVTDCTFSANEASVYDGGGVMNDAGAPIYTRCQFDENTATRYGGAVRNSNNTSSSFIDCTFTANSAATAGGAIMNWNGGNSLFEVCTFTGNTAESHGGAMYNYNSSSPVILDCIFEYNTSSTGNGGSICNYSGTAYPTIAYTQFLGNSSTNGSGGAIHHNYAGTLDLDHCLFIGNYASTYGGGFITYAGTTDMQHCTFTANNADSQGGGLLRAGGALNIVNTIAWGNTSPTGPDLYGTLTASYCDFGEAITGEGNLVADPNFTVIPSDGGDGWGDDPATPAFDESTNDDFGNLRLAAGSPCIDAGNSFITSAVDLDGNARAVDDPDMSDIGIGPVTYLDMGAYEYNPCVIEGDFNCDGIVDLDDYCIFAANWLAGAS